ncbi:MAG: M24 family metallopeptidase, partial [Alphaproteobacteria bacterium]|nr:M24 family metallopeptidase [Alphaproteobacteria bacterium]
MRAGDAFIAFEHKNKFYAVASSLELGNFQKHSRCDKVFSLETLQKELGSQASRLSGVPLTASIITLAAKKTGAAKVQVSADFPTALFLELKKRIPVEIAKGALFSERAIKSAFEQNEIRKANQILAQAFALVAELLYRSKISGKKLMLGGEVLTSEGLRKKIQALFLAEGLEPRPDLIIASGQQACDPHCLGMGPLRPNELIVVDLFAPLQKTRYWGDMTRTFL